MPQLDRDIQPSNTSNSALILVVDDDPAQSLILKKKLESKGYRVLEANTGKDAISIFEQQHPIMILLDAVMLDMDGFETCRRIRSLETGKDTIILMLTGLNDDESVKHAFDAGADEFITKPLYWSVLIGRVGYLLQAKTSKQKLRRLEEQLHQAQKMEAIGNLTNGIAHNFNNILTSIMGYTKLLQNIYIDDEKGKAASYLQQINKASKRAHDVISQMQAFTSKGIGNPEVLELTKLLEEAIRMLLPTLPASIEFHLIIQKDIPPVKIDPVQFQQIIMNMLLNARDAMDDKGCIDIELQKTKIRELHCASCHHEINGEFVELIIRDTGTGIEGSILRKMFDPYYTSKPFGETSGMGLSAVHGIVHEYEGHILVDTALEQGAVFKILFPVVDFDLSITKKAVEIEEDECFESGSSQHILVVDDEEMVGVYEVELLQINGYKATFMNDPQKAIDTVRARPEKYDLVLTDKTMPGLDGLELAGAIMAIREDLPIILCTGYSGALPDIDLKCIGIRAQLDKPVEGKVLLQTIKTVLEKA